MNGPEDTDKSIGLALFLVDVMVYGYLPFFRQLNDDADLETNHKPSRFFVKKPTCPPYRI